MRRAESEEEEGGEEGTVAEGTGTAAGAAEGATPTGMAGEEEEGME
jgi:hypothetical protein